VNGVPKHEPHKRQRNDDSEYDQEMQVHSAAYRGQTPGICAGSHRGTASGTGDRGDEQSRSPSLNRRRPVRQQFLAVLAKRDLPIFLNSDGGLQQRRSQSIECDASYGFARGSVGAKSFSCRAQLPRRTPEFSSAVNVSDLDFHNLANRTFKREEFAPRFVAGRLDPSQPRLCATPGTGRAHNFFQGS
jgi:hypothetical protein